MIVNLEKPFFFYYNIFLLIVCILFMQTLQAQNADINLLKGINPQYPNSGFQIDITNSVYPISFGTPAVLLASGFIAKDKALQYKGWEAAGSLVISVIITQTLKYSINRTRPYEKYNFIYPYDNSEYGKSFPSGHTSLAFNTATTLSLEFKKWYVTVPAFGWAAGVAYSRLYLGEHYPTDVIAGAVVGAGSAWLSHWATKKVFKR